jgi:hypothetical protein
MNLNPIDFNYIDGENIYPLQDYIDEQINNLVSTNIYTSNIYITPTKKLNEVIYYNGAQLNIENNEPVGQIQFKTSASYPNDTTKAGVIIDIIGKLKVYHNYNILQPLFPEDYYDVESELLQLKADGISTDAQLTLLDANILFVQQEIASIIEGMNMTEGQLNTLINDVYHRQTYESFRSLVESQNFGQVNANYGALVNNITLNATNQYIRNIAVGTLSSLALGFAAGAIGSFVSQIAYNRASNSLFSNTAITTQQKNEIFTSNLYNNEIISYSNFSISTSNLNVANGFINCNIITLQNIPIIKSSQITINNTGSATYSIINFSNATNNSAGYIGLGGIVSGYHNNNMIYNTPGAHIFNVPGQNSLSVPAFSINASACVGININPSAYPLYRFSVSGDVYIHNAALRTNSIIYNSQELSTTLNNYLLKSGGTMTGGLTTNSIIYNAQELSTTLNNYLLKSGGTMTDTLLFNTGLFANPGPYPNGFDGDRIILQTGIGTNGYPYSVGINTDVFWNCAPASASYKWYSGATNTATLNNTGLLTLPSINATSSITTNSIIYGGTELSTTVGNYLLKSGGTMTGQLAITANSASSLISLTNSGTVGQGILQINNLGGYARLTYYNSGAGGYYTCNYVLEASSNNAAIVMNTGGHTSNSIPRFILNSSGNIGIGISNPSAKLEVNGKIGCIGTLNCWSNVGIGVTNPYTLLHVRGTNPALTVMGQGGAGAISQINLSTYDTTTNAPNCSLIATDTGDFGATFQIKQKLATADTNAQFTSFIINKDGNVGIGSTSISGIKLYVNGKTRFSDAVVYPNGIWNMSIDGVYRTHYGTLSTSYYSCGSNGSEAHYFMKSAAGGYAPICIMYNDGMIMASGDNLRFPDTLNQFKINLWGTSNYGFGIASGTLMYSTQNWHKFYNFNVNTFTIDYNGDASLLRNLVTGGLTRSRNYYNYGVTLNYQASFNGYNAGGWYWMTNSYWQDISTVSYLCVAITCLGQNAVWFGRMFLGQGGGFYQTICDMRNPNGGTNTIDVYDIWGSTGQNAIRIVINNGTYGGQFNIKISG